MSAVALALPSRLSETGLYRDIQSKAVAPDALPFAPQYPLWSDGARKKRWLRLPPGTKIDARDPDRWRFPVGTRLWKEFTFGDHRVETRLEEKVEANRWDFGTYLWNEGETDAALAPDGGVADYYPLTGGLKHDIPSTAQCVMCHRKSGEPVLGVEALQLSDDRDALAPHKEPLQTGFLTLRKLMNDGLLDGAPPEWLTAPPRVHAATPEARAALGYLHANCASCHNLLGTAGHVGIDCWHTTDVTGPADEPCLQSTVRQPTRVYQIPGVAKSWEILPGDVGKSAMHFRMTLAGTGRMPQMATKIVDDEAVRLLGDWIRQLPAR